MHRYQRVTGSIPVGETFWILNQSARHTFTRRWDCFGSGTLFLLARALALGTVVVFGTLFTERAAGMWLFMRGPLVQL